MGGDRVRQFEVQGSCLKRGMGTACASVTSGASTSNSESNAWRSLLTKDCTVANISSSSSFAKACGKTICSRNPSSASYTCKIKLMRRQFRVKIGDVDLEAIMERGNDGGLKPRQSSVFSDVIASFCGCVYKNGLESRVRDAQTVLAGGMRGSEDARSCGKEE